MNDKMSVDEARTVDRAIDMLGKVFGPLKIAATECEKLFDQYGWNLDCQDLHQAASLAAAVYADLVRARDEDRKESARE